MLLVIKKVLKEILRELEYPKIDFYSDFINMKSKKIKVFLGNVILLDNL